VIKSVNRESILMAISEYDKRGQSEFLKHHGYQKARSYILVHEGRYYDSKAIVGVAYGYQFGTPLRSDEFSGGAKTVAALLNSLGFEVTTTMNSR